MANITDSIFARDLWFNVRFAYDRSHTLGYFQDCVGFTTPNVKDLIRRLRRFNGETATTDKIIDMNKIALLSPIFIDHGWIAVKQARGKNRQHPGVGIRESLTRAVDIKETQRYRRNVIGATNN